MQIFADYPTNFSEVTRKISLGNTAQRLCSAALYTLQCLLQVGENILDIFQTYRNADQSAVNACRFQLFFGQLAVGGLCRVQHTGANICHVYLNGSQLQRVHKADRSFSAALD